MQARSADSLQQTAEAWEPVLRGVPGRAGELAGQIKAVVDILDGSTALRRALTDPSRSGESRAALVGQILGGKVADNPHGPEIGTVAVHLTPHADDDFLFMGMSSPLAVQAAHSQSVTEIPRNAVLLAGNEHDVHQAFRIGDCAWGLQFHPEFDVDICRALIISNRDQLLEKGQDPNSLLSRCRETPHSADIMRRFALLFRKEIQ